MTLFKSVPWDSDVLSDDTYRELLKGIKRKKHENEVNGYINKEKYSKKKKRRKIKTNAVADLKPDEAMNFTGQQINVEMLTKIKRKRSNKQKQLGPLTSATLHNKNDQYAVKEQSESGGLFNKYRMELEKLSDDSKLLTSEMLKEKEKQNLLKKKLEQHKQIILSEQLESLTRKKFDDSEVLQKLKIIKKKLDNKILEFPRDDNEKKRIQSIGQSPRAITGGTDLYIARKKIKYYEKLKQVLKQDSQKKPPVISLRQQMMDKLKAARFRFLNEQIYKTDSKEAQKIFKSDPDAFKAYHEGYRQQVRRWPVNPLDVIINSIKIMPNTYEIADFGCGDGKLAKSVRQRVWSFDLVAVNETVIACDMSKVPLQDNSVDIVVCCLSLMGTNLQDYIFEANRVMKIGGILKIAEVESRFEDVDQFIKGVQHYGFRKTWKDLTHNLFYFLDFKKLSNIKNKKKLPTLSLLPCLYKKR